LGIISSIGNTLEEVTTSLRGGRSGIVLDEERLKLGFRSGLTGKIRNFDPKNYGISRKIARTMCEPALYGFAAAKNAVEDSKLTEEQLRSPRCGIVFGNDSTARAVVESIDVMREHKGTHFIGSGYIFRAMNSTVSMNLAAHFAVQGANWTLSAACASGAHVIGQALSLIRSSLQDIVIAGAAQELSWQCMASFDALGAFSTRHDAPQKASRPFDTARDGLVPSGGAAALIVEEISSAKKRGAPIYAIIRGYGFSSDAGAHLSEPSVNGASTAMKMALQDAQLEAKEITYVNAHATSTIIGDLAEAQAITEILGSSVPVSSTKSMTGHECWMAGASEALYTILMARDGFLAPNINFTEFSHNFPRINIVRETVPVPIKRALSNSFGFGGTNAVIVLEFPENL
jgi:3-oxoacyl-[acyl-carrier-protein] synthase-1